MPRYKWYRILFKGKYYQLYTGNHDCYEEIDVNDIERLCKTDNGSSFLLTDASYHTSWDWLMPVIETILDKAVELDDLERYSVVLDNIPYIEQTYDAVIEFIDWYNEQDRFICASCGSHVDMVFYDEERDADFCNDCKF
ncbi:MAG: hypothetical protein PQJ49_06265 [Sphaerochaetaceae bacterium]|nr:hypothetical protein [Sphaerochaetaceae bacterium]